MGGLVGVVRWDLGGQGQSAGQGLLFLFWPGPGLGNKNKNVALRSQMASLDFFVCCPARPRLGKETKKVKPRAASWQALFFCLLPSPAQAKQKNEALASWLARASFFF